MTGLSLTVLAALVDEARDECVGTRGGHDDYVADRALGALSYVLRRAIADTHAKRGDAQQAPSLMSGGGAEGNRPRDAQ